MAATTLEDFATRDAAACGTVRMAAGGEPGGLVERDGTPLATAEVSDLPPDEAVILCLETGEVVDE